MLQYDLQNRHSHNADLLPDVGEYAKYATTATPAFDAANSVSMQAKAEIQLMFKTSDMEGRMFAAI